MRIFIEVEIDYNGIGRRDSYLDLLSIVCFRKNDYNGKTVVYTENHSFNINKKYEDFCKIMLKYFPKSFNTKIL